MILKKHWAIWGTPRSFPGSLLSRAPHHFQYRLPGKSKIKTTGSSHTLDAIFASLPDGVAAFDQGCHYLKANPAFMTILSNATGQPVLDLTGKDHFKLFPDPRLEPIFHQVLTDAQPYQAAGEMLPFLQPSGQEPCYWDWSLFPLRNDPSRANSSIHGLVLTIRPAQAPLRPGQADEALEEPALRRSARRLEASEAHARASENLLRLTQLMYQHLFESTPDSNIIVNEDGAIVAVNHQTEALLGYSREELTGKKVEILVPEDQRDLHETLRSGYLRDASARMTAKEKILRLELSARRKDGSLIPTEITLNPVKAGSSLLILYVIRDISLRVQHENELRTQSDLVRLLQDIAVAANEASTVQGAFQYALQRINQQLGWQLGHAYLIDEDGALSTSSTWTQLPGTPASAVPAEAAGSTEAPADGGQTPTGESLEVPSVFRREPPARQPGAEQFAVFKAVSEAVRFHSGQGLPGSVLAAGQPVWLNDLPENPQFTRAREARLDGLQTGLAVPVLAGKEVVGILEFFHDKDVPPNQDLLAILPHIGVQLGRVVERNRSEEALRKTAAQLRMVMNNLPVILWVTDREGHIILIEGKGTTTMYPPVETLQGKNIFSLYATRPDILNTMRLALSGQEVHTEIKSGNGSVLDAYLMPYFDVNWAVDGVIGLSFDISERKRMESELNEMRHRLMDSMDNERARLAAQLHDGPLQDLYGAYYQIQDIRVNLDENNQETVESALQTIQNVNATLRIICGELHPNTLVHLGLEKAIRSHAERNQEHLEGIVVHLDLDNDGQNLPHSLRLSLYRIYQQLFNNSAHHSSAPDIWIRLRLQPEQVLLEVEDNGRGFEQPSHWIELVRQGKLGLASAMERTESLNGKMIITTQPGQGTRVQVIVPLAQP